MEDVMHKEWCGKKCENCRTSCSLDEELYCSPDCEFLSEDGEMNFQTCHDCDAWKALRED